MADLLRRGHRQFPNHFTPGFSGSGVSGGINKSLALVDLVVQPRSLPLTPTTISSMGRQSKLLPLGNCSNVRRSRKVSGAALARSWALWTRNLV